MTAPPEMNMRSAVIAGATVGALILGLAGRAAMAGIALLEGVATNLTLRGVLETLILGALMGAVGGASLLEAGRRLGLTGIGAGLLVGAALFTGSLAVSWLGGAMQGAGLASLPTLGVAAVFFLAYGAATERVLRR
jgi:hypothetical protein